MGQREFRWLVTALRARIGLAERQLYAGKPEKVNYGAVPAQAMLKYRNAFERRNGERFEAYLTGVCLSENRIHAETLFPYEVLRPFFKDGYLGHSDPNGMDALETITCPVLLVMPMPSAWWIPRVPFIAVVARCCPR